VAIGKNRRRRVAGVVDIDRDRWRTSKLQVIGFVQERDSLRILGAAATTLAS
jgi:hypothetical protein